MYKVEVWIVKCMMIESHMRLFHEKDLNGPSYDDDDDDEVHLRNFAYLARISQPQKLEQSL